MSQVSDKFKVYVCSERHFEYINNILMYILIDCTRVIIILPIALEKPISYKSLLKRVVRKYGLPLHSNIRMKYKMNQFVIDITDDVDDLDELLTHAINNAPIKLYIVDSVRNVLGMGGNQPSNSSSGGFQ